VNWIQVLQVASRLTTNSGFGFLRVSYKSVRPSAHQGNWQQQFPYHVTCVQALLITILGESSNSECYTPSSEPLKNSDDGV
jgi:hypothetical protein